MKTVLGLLAIQGLIGAFDTVYFHEWRARLPALGAISRPELRLHAVRSLIYAIVFGTLPWFSWGGMWTLLLAALLATEIIITLCDFVVEDRVRKPLGGVFPVERVTHAVMGIIYGGMLACLVPIMLTWWSRPSTFSFSPDAEIQVLNWVLTLMAFGVFLSGLRDLCAVLQLPHSSWPWDSVEAANDKPRTLSAQSKSI